MVSKDLIFDKSDIMVGWLNANRPFFFNITIFLLNITKFLLNITIFLLNIAIVTADW